MAARTVTVERFCKGALVADMRFEDDPVFFEIPELDIFVPNYSLNSRADQNSSGMIVWSGWLGDGSKSFKVIVASFTRTKERETDLDKRQ